MKSKTITLWSVHLALLSSLFLAGTAYADDDAVTINPVTVKECGTQKVDISGTAAYHNDERKLTVTLNGEMVITASNEPTTWSFTPNAASNTPNTYANPIRDENLDPGTYNVVALIRDQSPRFPNPIASAEITFTIADCNAPATAEHPVATQSAATTPTVTTTSNENEEIIALMRQLIALLITYLTLLQIQS